MAPSSRRGFLRTGALGAAAGLAVACTLPAAPPAAPTPPLPADTAAAVPAAPANSESQSVSTAPAQAPVPTGQTQASVATGQKALVVLQLSGGHDGLNAVIPYGDALYYQLRPQIGIPADRVLHLDDQVGLHPNLTSFKTLYDQRQLAILQGVGYPNPNRSHFRSMEIWHSARPDGPVPDQG